MKKITKYIKAGLLLLVLSLQVSCDESFIELAPISNANVNSFYKSPADFETAIMGVYNQWQSVYNTRWTEYNEFRADTYTHVQYSYYEIAENIFTLNTTAGFWNELYKVITFSNIILDRIEGVEFENSSDKDRIKAEAAFFRAEAYFALVRFFGPVPLIVHETNSKDALKVGRTPVTTIFDQIEEDYLYAVANLPTTIDPSEYGRISKFGAQGELARVYVTLSGAVYNEDRWSDAVPLLEDVLFNSPFDFADTYEEIFAEDGSGEKGKEVVLSAVFKAGGEGEASNYNRQFVGRYGGHPVFENGVYESFETDDVRRDINIALDYISLEGALITETTNVKFDWGYDIGTGTSGLDFPILRYTDAYLLYAEAKAEIAGNVPTESLDILNKVRTRAGLTALTTTDIPNLNSFRTAMQKERRSELMFECVRWFDMVRTGTAVEILTDLGKPADNTWLLFPIPQIEIDIIGKSVLPQNLGY